MEARGPDAPVDHYSRLMGSQVGRWAVVAFVAVVATWIVGPNLSAGPARDRLDVLWWPADRAGFVQNWAVFSPDPRDQSLDVRARIEHVDGDVEWWDVPDLDPFVGAYREYRWNKWQERVRLDARSDLWDATAAWIAEQHTRDGVLPARVILVRRWVDHEPVTDDGAIDSEINEYEFHVWEPR